MTTRRTDEFDRADADSAELPDRTLPDDLPPVQPPSAGFIVQLFLVPAIIVLVIVGLFLTFRTLVSGNQDWQSLVAELRSSNEHRRWRGAHGLAQMLQADVQRGDSGEHLAQNPQIATELVALTNEQLAKHSNNEDDQKQLAFLTLSLGYLDSPGLVHPALQKAMKSDQHIEVRKNALAAVAHIADRSTTIGKPLDDPALTADVIAISSDSETLIRQTAAFLLGLFSGNDSLERLTVMLQDGDAKTRLNAAIALARRHSAAGADVLTEVLRNPEVIPDAPKDKVGAKAEFEDSEIRRQREKNAREFEELVSLVNCLKAVTEIAPQLSNDQRSALRKLVEPLAANHTQPRIRVEAQSALTALSQGG